MPTAVSYGELLLRDEVAPPQLEPVDPELGRHLVDHDLDVVGRLGPAGAADRVGPASCS